MMQKFLFLFVSSLSMIMGNELKDSLEIPALGRPFSLGALYDVRQDRLVAPGLKLWNPTTLESNVFERSSPYTNTKVLTTESKPEKASVFDVSAELSASFYGGLMQVSGAASYLSDEVDSNYKASLTFRYQRKTHMKELSMEHLSKFDHPTVFDNEEATHVVTRIVYGANAVFNFWKQAKNFEEKTEILGQLNVVATFATVQISAEAHLNMTKYEKIKNSAIQCNFKGDVDVPNPPVTLLDAIKIYSKLPSMITTKTSVPMDVYLYPLSMLDNKAKRIVRKISESMLGQVEQRMEKYSELRRSLNDMARSQAYKYFRSVERHVEDFKSGLMVHQNQFTGKLLEVLPRIRGGGKAEEELAKILDESGHKFSMRHLSQWVELKEREIGVLNSLCEWNENLLLSGDGVLNSILMTGKQKYVLLLNVKVYREEDEFTRCLRDMCEEPFVYETWLTRPFGQQVRKTFSNFQEMIRENEFLKSEKGVEVNTRFVIGESVLENGRKPIIGTDVYTEGSLLTEHFEHPLILNPSAAHHCTNSEVSWFVTDDKKYMDPSFILFYRNTGSKEWLSLETQKMTIRFPHKPSDIQYKVLGSCEFGVCSVVHGTLDNPIRCLDEEVWDCGSIKKVNPSAVSGHYLIKNGIRLLSVWCDMETQGGGWIVLQRRVDGSVNFTRNWYEYKMGFGNVGGEFWLGNQNLYELTKRRNYDVLVELREEGRDCVLYALFSGFAVESECNGYRLASTAQFLNGTAGDPRVNPKATKQEYPMFSTYDHDNDMSGAHCPRNYGGGWWYNPAHNCGNVNLNGLYSSVPCVQNHKGVTFWAPAHNRHYSFPQVEIKMRRSELR